MRVDALTYSVPISLYACIRYRELTEAEKTFFFLLYFIFKTAGISFTKRQMNEERELNYLFVFRFVSYVACNTRLFYSLTFETF